MASGGPGQTVAAADENYGYDEIGDRFDPHVTEAAPNDPEYRGLAP
jgi:hypothetical protein